MSAPELQPQEAGAAPPKPKKPKRPRQPSTRYMSLQEAADHFCVSEATVRLGRGLFKLLRQFKLGRRTLVLRQDVAALDRRIERAAVAIQPGL